MATFFNLPTVPVPVSFTNEGFTVMSDGFIVDMFGFIVGNMIPVFQPQFQPQFQPETSLIKSQSTLVLDKPLRVFGSSDEIKEKEHVPLNIYLSPEHPGVLMAKELLDRFFIYKN